MHTVCIEYALGLHNQERRGEQSRMPKSDDKGRLVRALIDTSMSRVHLVKALLDKPKYISQLAGALGMDRSTVSYHLAVMESVGLLDSHYEILQPPRSVGKAARVYSVNKAKLKEALDLVLKLQKLSPT